MAKFYGSIIGNRGMATRMGSADSGFKATCQSYDGSIITSMGYNWAGKLVCRVGTCEGSGFGSDWQSDDFIGSFEDFKKLLTLNKQIKNGEVSIVHHRKK